MTKIEWTEKTWNPITGCTKVSPGCDHCYAEGIARRFAGSKAFPNGFDVTLRPERLDAPLRWRKPATVFVNSMSDLFHDDVPTDFIASVFSVMAATPQHTYQVLTKRPGRMKSLLNRPDFRFLATPPTNHAPMPDWPLPNVWLGVSVEDQKWANVRIPALLDTPAAVRFLSCEPLLGPVDLKPWMVFSETTLSMELAHRLQWVIVGGESGPGARPMHPSWALHLRNQCTSTGVAFFFKQWGSWAPVGSAREWVAGARMLDETGAWLDEPLRFDQTVLGAVAMQQRSKTAAGRVLDGRTWDEYPQPVSA